MAMDTVMAMAMVMEVMVTTAITEKENKVTETTNKWSLEWKKE